jgi:glutaconyl-CoA decarboxylase
MTVLDSLLVGVFGLSVVFVVLIGLSLLVRLQSGLYARLTNRKTSEAAAIADHEKETAAGEAAAPAVPDAETGKAAAALPGKAVSSGTENHQPSAGPRSNTGECRVISAERLTLTVNNITYQVQVEEEAEKTAPLKVSRPSEPAVFAAPSPAAVKPVPAPPMQAQAPAVPADGAGGIITAPVPGTVIDIKTAVGAAVKRGDILVLLEAMKMENEIMAAMDGTVAQILTAKGAAVDMGAPLVVIR